MRIHKALQRVRPRTAGLFLVALAAAMFLATAWLAGSPSKAIAADRWNDITNDRWAQTYGITADEAAQVASGYPDGTFRPTQAVTRGQFAKMVVDGLGLATATPATPTYPDVRPGTTFYPWIEGGAAAGVISGYPDGTFGPAKPMIRQQCNSLLGRYLSGEEIESRGGIQGTAGLYLTLAAWFAAEGESHLVQFSDASDLVAAHRPTTAYLVYRGVVSGSSAGGLKFLKPTTSVTRAQAVAMVTRTANAAEEFVGPAVTLLNPTSGPVAGGTQVTITGTGFVGVSAVTFGGSAATGITVNSVTQITATAPAHAAGLVDVRVATPAGTSANTLADDYTYVSPAGPTVTALNPTSGPAAGGNQVVITGTNLTGATAVVFGTTTLISGFTVDSATQITVTAAPAGTGTVDVRVATPAGTSANTAVDDYTYLSPAGPTVTALNPTSGSVAGGNQVVITGTNLTGATVVTFGAASLTSGFTVNSATQITVASAPTHAAGTVDVIVTTPAGASANTAADDYTYVSPAGPTVGSLNPTSGPATGGNSVTITGTNLTGATAVIFGATTFTSGFTVDSATQITVTAAPAGTGTVDVRVTTPAGTSANTAADDYVYVSLVPTVTAVSPNSGPLSGWPANVKVIITGTNLTGATAVSFGATNAPSFTVNSGTQITVNGAPAHTAGSVDITVTAPNGTSANTAADDYLYYGGLLAANGATFQVYSVSGLQGMTAVAGYGGFLNTFPSFKGPWSFTGVAVLSILSDVGGLPAGHGVKIIASDGYTKTFTYDQVKNNNFTMYDPSSDPSSPTVIGPGDITGSLQLIVAYEQDGGAIPADPGPLRIAIVSSESGEQATDSVNWVKMVVKIEVQ